MTRAINLRKEEMLNLEQLAKVTGASETGNMQMQEKCWFDDNHGIIKRVHEGVSTILKWLKYFPKPRCFAEDAKISVPNGTKFIKDIKVGDEVISLDRNDNKIISKVTRVQPIFTEKILEVEFSNGTTWKATETQWFYCGNDDYASIIDTKGKSAITESGRKVAVVRVSDTGKTVEVYDFIVEGTNVFFANGIAAEGYSNPQGGAT